MQEENFRNRLSGAAMSLLVLCGFWELISIIPGDANPFPPPSRFMAAALERGLRIGIGGQASTIPEACILSIMRVLAGLSLATVAALLFATQVALHHRVYRLMHPLVQFFGPVAPVAWVPLGLVAFGIGNVTAVFIVFMGVVFLLSLAFTEALRAADRRYGEASRAVGLKRFQHLAKVVLPAAAPRLLGSIRINLLSAWAGVLAGEMTGLGDGLGAVVMIGRNLYDYNLVALGIFLMALIGLILDLLLHWLQERYLWW